MGCTSSQDDSSRRDNYDSLVESQRLLQFMGDVGCTDVNCWHNAGSSPGWFNDVLLDC